MANKIWRNDTSEDAFVIDIQGVYRKIRPGDIVVGDFFQQVDAVLTQIGTSPLPARSGRSLHIVGRQEFTALPQVIRPVIEVTRIN